MTDPDTGTPESDGTRPEPEGPPAPHIPPPAFPPGNRRRQMRRRRDRDATRAGVDEAFISPDDPIPERDEMARAFISPDEPLPERSEGEDEAFISPDDPIPHRDPLPGSTLTVEPGDEDEVVVTGMGSDAHLDPEEMQAAGDPHVLELTEAVSKLAQALKQKGEAGLRAHPEMSRFEATLRAYCVGYLAGRRADDEA